MEDDTVVDEALLNRSKNKFRRCVSHARDELHSFRSYLRWMCVDQSSVWRACLSWFMFILFGIVVPAVSHFLFGCAACDSKHKRPYDSVVQLSLSSVASLSFVCLTRFVKKFGLRRFLFFDKLYDESETVRKGYTAQLNRSLQLLCFFVIPIFASESVYKIWWYASEATQIPFLGSVYVSAAVACVMELCSWLYRTTVIFLVCVLFRLICYLQILRLQDFATMFEVDSDVGSVLSEHLRIRRHLRIISHRCRAFILWSLILVTGSQFALLLITTKSSAKENLDVYRAGELVLCSITLVTGLFILLRSATKITHKAQAVTCLAAKWHVCATLDSFDAAAAEITSGRALAEAVGTERGESDNEEGDADEDELDNTKLIPSYAYSTISFQKDKLSLHILRIIEPESQFLGLHWTGPHFIPYLCWSYHWFSGYWERPSEFLNRKVLHQTAFVLPGPCRERNFALQLGMYIHPIFFLSFFLFYNFCVS